MRSYKKTIIFLFLFFLSFFFSSTPIAAETKMTTSTGEAAGMIPKLPKTPNDPELINGHVYPSWGPPCQRYTYSVIYQDKEGRKPEYVKIYFNGKMIDLQPVFNKSTAGKKDYQNGVRYEYKYVPNKIGSNFYYFEASNGLGKARASIIDSPDNGPVLFESAFDKNEIALIDTKSGKKILSYPTGKEWVGQVALSDDGKYLTAQTSYRVLLFDTDSPQKSLWEWRADETGQPIGGDMKGGVAISGDGSTIAATVGNKVLLFDKASNKPLWEYEAPAFKVAISKDGKYLAAAALKENLNDENNFLILWKKESNKPLWEFSNNSNFHDVTLSDDGAFISASTGCPDRKAYIFSKDSNIPLVKSERLTSDSPVSRSKITADGSLAAYSTEGGPDSSVVVLFSRDSSAPLWKFDNGKRNSSRALSITSDGKFIAAATMAGDVYLLNKERNTPLKSWQINASLGALDLSNDGSVLAVGGTDKKIHLLSKDTQFELTVDMNEFIDNLDVSANGKYVAVGTGGAVYFFEDYISPAKNKVFPCTTILEPPPQSALMNIGEGNPEESVPRLKSPPFEKILPIIVSFIGFVASFLSLLGYCITVKFNLLRKPEENILHLNRKVIIVLAIISGLFLTGGTIFLLSNKPSSPSLKEGKVIMNKEKNGTCGNDLCEPGLGETKDNCPKDCSAE